MRLEFFHTFRNAVLTSWIVVCGVGNVASAQTRLSTENFDNAAEWPVYSAGEIKLNNDKIGNFRVAYDGIFQSPEGPLKLATYIDVSDVMYKGIPAQWMQWSFTSEEEGGDGVPNLDLLIMDKKTGGLRFRMLPAGQGSEEWDHLYNFIGVSSEAMKRTVFLEDGSVKTEEIKIDSSVFDFGGLPFVLPFMDLKPGQGMRLNAYQQSGVGGIQLLDVKVIGPAEVTDTKGARHNVLEVQTAAPSRTSIISFYVSDKAPYFYGWDYRKVEDGTSLFKMIYRGYVPTEIAS